MQLHAIELPSIKQSPLIHDGGFAPDPAGASLSDLHQISLSQSMHGIERVQEMQQNTTADRLCYCYEDDM